MKNIYTWKVHSGYARYWTVESIDSDENLDEEDYWNKNDIAESFLSFSKNPHDLPQWNPPILKEEIDDEDNISRLKGDFHSVWSYESYIVSQNMVDEIGDILNEYGDLFPLNAEDREDKLYRYWVNKEIPFEYVNKQKSKFFDKDYSDDNVFKIENLVFKEDYEIDAMIFRIKEEYKKTIFVTEEFIELVKKHNLKGFKFIIDTSYEYANNYGSYILVG